MTNLRISSAKLELQSSELAERLLKSEQRRRAAKTSLIAFTKDTHHNK